MRFVATVHLSSDVAKHEGPWSIVFAGFCVSILLFVFGLVAKIKEGS